MPYDLPFLTTARRKIKREAEEIARREAERLRTERFRAAIARQAYAPPETGIPPFDPNVPSQLSQRGQSFLRALTWPHRVVEEPVGAAASVFRMPRLEGDVRSVIPGVPAIPGVTALPFGVPKVRGGFEFNPEQLPWEPDWREAYHRNVPEIERALTEAVTSPFNLLPVVGFTKAEDIARLARGAARGAKAAARPVTRLTKAQVARAGADLSDEDFTRFAEIIADADLAPGGVASPLEARLEGTLPPIIQRPTDPLELAELRLYEAREELAATLERGMPAPKFGEHERAEFDAARMQAAQAGRPILPKVQRVRNARAKVRQAKEEVTRLKQEAAVAPILKEGAEAVPAAPVAQGGAIQVTPPPLPGTVRLYRGEPQLFSPYKAAPIDDSLANYGRRMDTFRRWFSFDLEAARRFGPYVKYVDVPAEDISRLVSEASTFLGRNERIAFSPSGGFVLPPELVEKATRLVESAAPPPQTGSLQSTFGDVPAQGELGLGGRIGAQEPVPLIDPAQVAERQRLAQEAQAGQRGLPEAVVKRPLLHGSPTTGLTEIRPSNGDYGYGVYLTSSERLATDYSRGRRNLALYVLGDVPTEPKAGTLYTVNAELKNPLTIRTEQEYQTLLSQHGDSDRTLGAWAKQQGHDGILNDVTGEHILFRDTPVPVSGVRPATPGPLFPETAATPPIDIPPQGPPAGGRLPPPAGIPPAGPPPRGGVATATDGGEYLYPPADTNIFNFQPIQVGLSRTENLRNIARRTVGRAVRATPLNEVATPAMNERRRVQAIIDSQGNVLGASTDQALRRVFDLDKQGRLQNLVNVDPSLPGAPTIADVAARLPVFEQKLTGEQLQALRRLEQSLAPYKSILDRMGIETGKRADVMEGGFYVPRGRADVEGADEPIRALGIRRRGKAGFERAAVFESQAEGIKKGYEYAPTGEAVEGYVKDVGRRTLDEHLGNFFKAVRDDTGELIGETPKVRLLRQNPSIAIQKQGLDRNLNRLKSLLGRLTERQQRIIDDFIANPAFDDIDALRQALVNVRAKGGPSVGAGIRETQQLLQTVKTDLRLLAPEWKRALERARQTPRGEGLIDIGPLANRTYPMEIANAANAVLLAERGATGPLAPVLGTVEALNNLYRGFNATLDNSSVGIQGLLGLANDQKAWGRAVQVNFRALAPGGQEALGKFINHFDDVTTGAGRLDSVGWSREGLRVGGQPTEFMLGQGPTAALSRLPVIRQANRAFGFFGDTLRLGWADDLLKAELRKGRTLDEILASGDARRVAAMVNGATGWSAGKTFGNMGDLLLFAPRFLQSRLETVARGGIGLRPGATLEQRQARNSLLRLIGYGTLLTVAVNEMLGEDTDWRPIVDGRYNSNFMRIRFGGRDWSVFGTWDSLARMFVMTASGKPHEAVRGMASGLVSNAWDIITNEAFTGVPVRDTPQQFAMRMLENFTPFAAEELPAAGKRILGGEPVAGTVTVLGELLGVKSTPLSAREATDLARQMEMERRGLTGAFDDQNVYVRDSINKAPLVAQAKTKWEVQQRQRKSKWRAYQDEADAIDAKYDGFIQTIEKTFGPGLQYRRMLAEHESNRALEQDALKARSSEELEWLADIEPRKAVLDQGIAMYMRALTDPKLPPLENEALGQYDFDERDRRIENLRQNPQFIALEKQHGDDLIKAVQDAIHRKDTPLMAQLRADRELLKDYWAVSKKVLDLPLPDSVKTIWQQYLAMDSPNERLSLELSHPVIKKLNQLVSSARQNIRKANPTIDAALVRWEYGPRPATIEGIKAFEESISREPVEVR